MLCDIKFIKQRHPLGAFAGLNRKFAAYLAAAFLGLRTSFSLIRAALPERLRK